MLFEDMFAHFCDVLSQYEVVVKINNLGIQRYPKRTSYWGRITRKPQVDILGAHFAFENVQEKPPEDTAFFLDALKTCYDMVQGTVDLHVYVMEHEDQGESVQVSENPMAKRLYVVRDSAKHALSIAFMSPYANPKLYKNRFYYMRKVKAYGHALPVWPSSMVVAAPADENFDIGAEAERLD